MQSNTGKRDTRQSAGTSSSSISVITLLDSASTPLQTVSCPISTKLPVSDSLYKPCCLILLTRYPVTWSLSGFTIICITILSCSSPDYNSAEYVIDNTLYGVTLADNRRFVFRKFINETGWPDGVAWLLGVCSLIQASFSIF